MKDFRKSRNSSKLFRNNFLLLSPYRRYPFNPEKLIEIFPKATVQERLKSYPMRYNFPREGVEEHGLHTMCMSGGMGECVFARAPLTSMQKSLVAIKVWRKQNFRENRAREDNVYQAGSIGSVTGYLQPGRCYRALCPPMAAHRPDLKWLTQK